MPPFFQELYTQLKTLLKNLPPGKRVTLLTVASGSIISFIVLMIWAGRPDFELLYSNLAPEDAGAIVAKLKEQKIPYQISSNGSSILVPKERIYEIRLELASQGLPRGGGVGFEIFDRTKLGMTEFVQNVNYQRALQGELARTINEFAEVESTRVHLVIPQKSLFIEEEEPATASVVLKLHLGKRLSQDQVQGIVHLVSSSVPGLNPENVTVVDIHGQMLAGFTESSLSSQFTSSQLQLQQEMEKSLEKKIKTMLERALGPEKAIVRVSLSLDFKRIEKTEERYDPENRVVRSEQLTSENSRGLQPIPIGVPGVVSNLSGEKTITDLTKNSGFQKQDRTVNYEIGKVTSHIVEPIGRIKRISVAALIDGTYKMVKGEEGEEERKYFPRTQEEMEKYENIIKRAVGFNAARGDQVEVVNIPFEPAKPMEREEVGKRPFWFFLKEYYTSILKYAFLAIFVLLLFIFVVRPLIKWLTSMPVTEIEIAKKLPKTVEELEKEYAEGKKKLAFKDQALEVAKSDHELSVQLMRNWLKEE
jgi:flagellar M-ring protein FliF